MRRAQSLREARVQIVVRDRREEFADRVEDAIEVVLVATIVELATGYHGFGRPWVLHSS